MLDQTVESKVQTGSNLAILQSHGIQNNVDDVPKPSNNPPIDAKPLSSYHWTYYVATFGTLSAVVQMINGFVAGVQIVTLGGFIFFIVSGIFMYRSIYLNAENTMAALQQQTKLQTDRLQAQLKAAETTNTALQTTVENFNKQREQIKTETDNQHRMDQEENNKLKEGIAQLTEQNTQQSLLSEKTEHTYQQQLSLYTAMETMLTEKLAQKEKLTAQLIESSAVLQQRLEVMKQVDTQARASLSELSEQHRIMEEDTSNLSRAVNDLQTVSQGSRSPSAEATANLRNEIDQLREEVHPRHKEHDRASSMPPRISPHQPARKLLAAQIPELYKHDPRIPKAIPFLQDSLQPSQIRRTSSRQKDLHNPRTRSLSPSPPQMHIRKVGEIPSVQQSASSPLQPRQLPPPPDQRLSSTSTPHLSANN